jgi:hypothetical protein
MVYIEHRIAGVKQINPITPTRQYSNTPAFYFSIQNLVLWAYGSESQVRDNGSCLR